MSSLKTLLKQTRAHHMSGFNDHADTERRQCFINRFGDVLRHAFLNLQSSREHFHNSGELAQSDDLLVGQIADCAGAIERNWSAKFGDKIMLIIFICSTHQDDVHTTKTSQYPSQLPFHRGSHWKWRHWLCLSEGNAQSFSCRHFEQLTNKLSPCRFSRYPLVRKSIALAARSGVFSSPSRRGFSPMCWRMDI